MSLSRKALLARVGAGAVMAGTVVSAATVASAASSQNPRATGAHFTTPAPGTKITGNLKSGTTMTFSGTVNGLPITVTCTTFTGSGVAPKTGLTVKIGPPTISGCKDSLGGTDVIKTNAT